MSNEITLNGMTYISAGSASKSFHMTRDYIARLCRENRVKGERIGKSWFVVEQSLKEFLLSQKYSRALRAESLSQERRNEYYIQQVQPAASMQRLSQTSQTIKQQLEQTFAQRRSVSAATAELMNTPSGVAHAALQAAHIPIYQVTPFLEVIHKLMAVLCACFIFFAGYAILDPIGMHSGTVLAYNGIQKANSALESLTTTLPANTKAFTASASDPIQALQAVSGGTGNSIMHIITRASDDVAATIKNPSALLGPLSPNSTSTVSIQITSYAPSAAEPAAAETSAP